MDIFSKINSSIFGIKEVSGKLSSNLISYATLFGYSDFDFAKKAQFPLFDTPGIIEVEKSIPNQTICFYTNTLQESKKKVQTIINDKWSYTASGGSTIFSMDVKVTGKTQTENMSTSNTKSEEIYSTELNVYSVGIFKYPCSSLLLSKVSTNCIRSIST
jgi:hypothetical protein